MGTPAIGFYIDRLTVLRGMKIGGVATAAGVKPGYVSRLISGDIKEPSARVLKALTDAVGGSWDDIGMLLDEGASQEQAEMLADAWYARTSKAADTTERDLLQRRLLAAIRMILEDDELLRSLRL